MNKRYIIVCLGCDQLTEVHRTDALTCSAACRVWVHRHPELLRESEKAALAVRLDEDMSLRQAVGLLLRTRAVRALRPELFERVANGSMTVDEAEAECLPVFDARVLEVIRQTI